MKSRTAAIQEIVTLSNVAILALVVILFALSFQSGRWTQRVANRAQVLRDQMQSHSDASNKNSYSESADLEKILIANVATVGFDELYDVVRSAPERKRVQWVQELDALPDGAQKTAALESFYKTFVQIDPEAAAASIDTLHDVGTKMTAAEAMVGAAPASGLQYAAQMLLKLPREFVSTHSWDYLGDVFDEWSAIEPEAVARFFDQHPKDQLTDYYWRLLYDWGALDPASASAWLERQPKPDDDAEQADESAAVGSLLSGWFEKDRAGAENYAILHADQHFANPVENIAHGAFLASPAEAHSFIDRLPNDKLKSAALIEIATTTRANDLPFADPAQSPDLVANWLLTFGDSCTSAALTMVVTNWKDRDPDGLNAWINQLPPATRDRVALDYCYNSDYDERFIVPLAMNISDSGARDAAIEHFLSRWLPRDPDNALKAIDDSQLTDSQKSYLLKLLPRVKKSSTSE